MARKPEFPITLKAGATAIKIYYDPQRVRHSSEEKKYDSYVVSYYLGEKRCRSRFNSLEDARTEAQRIQTRILNQDVAALQLSGNDRAIYGRSLESIEKFGLALDVVAAEYAAARDKLGSTSLLEAIEFYLRFGRTIKEVKAVPVIVEELVRDIKADGVSDYHLRDLATGR